MLVKWIRSILNNQANELSDQVVDSTPSKSRQAEMVDLASEAIRHEGHDLDELVRTGFHGVTRKRRYRTIKGLVEENIDSTYDETEIVEEITERILNAAEIDPLYARLFGEEELKK